MAGEAMQVHGIESDGLKLRVGEIEGQWGFGLTVFQVTELGDVLGRES